MNVFFVFVVVFLSVFLESMCVSSLLKDES